MARGKKNMTIDEKIADIEAKIVETENLLNDYKKERAELIAQKEEEELKSLYTAIKASGKTIDEVLEQLSK